MNLKKLRAPVTVGILLVVGVLSLLYMISAIKEEVFSSDDTYMVYAIFEDVTGLAVKGAVHMVGIPVGMIESIERADTPDGVRAKVGIRVQSGVTLFAGIRDESGSLRGAAAVTRKQLSILGDYYLTLSPGAFGEALKEGDAIPLVIGVSGLDAMLEQADRLKDIYPKLDRIASNVESLTEGLALALGGKAGGDVLKELMQNLQTVSAQLKTISQDASSLSGELHGMVEDGTLRSIANNVQETTRDARSIAGRFEEIVAAGDVEELVTNLAETSRQLSATGLKLNQLMEEGINPRVRQLDRIFRNFEVFSGNLASFSLDNGGAIRETLENVRTFSRQLVGLADKGGAQLDQAMGTVQGTLGAAKTSMTKLDETLDNLRAITTDLREGKGSIGRLLTDDKLVVQVEEIIEDTRDFVKSYALMQTEIQLATSWFVDSSSFKNTFSVRFQPREDKYYLLQLVDDPRGYTNTETIVTQSSADGLTSERVETTSHSLEFSVQFAKTWYFITGRFGLMENTGGLGLDLHFFNKRLQFQFDLFDFTMNTNPRLRTQVEWEFLRHLFVAAGADDLMNAAYRDYYFSAGVRFTDRDLKAMLFTAPSISP